MNWNIRSFVLDSILVCFISVIILTILNFVFVYFSPVLVKQIPQDFTRFISPCYRTLFHYDGGDLSQANFVFGDSFSEGAGDEFLLGDPEYGIFNKLESPASTELIFGRVGYGNKGSVIEFERCFPLLSKYTSFPTDKIENYVVTFVFYEGNDLNNNLVEVNHYYSKILYKISFLFPMHEYIYKKSRYLLESFYRFFKPIDKMNDGEDMFPVSTSGVSLGRYPQSAAVELNENELSLSLGILDDSLRRISDILPSARSFRLLYLPSVASSYNIEGNMHVQSYGGFSYYLTTGQFNRDRSLKIRKSLSALAAEINWEFCDSTSAILELTSRGIAVHGPVDWKHFNKSGYATVAGVFEQCVHSSNQ